MREFKIGEYIWHSCIYHTVEIADGRSWELPDIRVMLNWATETFGEPGRVWSSTAERYYTNSGKFFFRDKGDLTLFLLRWS